MKNTQKRKPRAKLIKHIVKFVQDMSKKFYPVDKQVFEVDNGIVYEFADYYIFKINGYPEVTKNKENWKLIAE